MDLIFNKCIENDTIIELPPNNKGIQWIKNDPIVIEYLSMGSRICDNCGKKKDTYGGKTYSHGHFICHSCASGHVHCPLCRHTLR